MAATYTQLRLHAQVGRVANFWVLALVRPTPVASAQLQVEDPDIGTGQ